MKKTWVFVLSACLLLMLAAPAFAADGDILNRLERYTPTRHRYWYSVGGGAAIGAGIGAILGGFGNDVTKGMLVGGGGASTAYLHTHRGYGGGWRPWMMLGGDTALGAGIGWTVCGCNTGLAAGTLVGGGASAIWQASQPHHTNRTAQRTQP